MPHAMVKRRLNGHRGGFLLLVSTAWALLGATYVFVPVTKSRSAGFAWLPEWIGLNELGLIWWVVAAIVAFIALRWPGCERREQAAFGLLTIPPALWAIIFLFAWILGEHPLGYVTALAYSIFTAVVLYCGGWPNAPWTVTKESWLARHLRKHEGDAE